MAVQSLSAKAKPGDLAVEILKQIDALESLPAHIDFAIGTNKQRTLIGGWAEDVLRGDLFVMDEEFLRAPMRLDSVAVVRDDVSSHLRKLGRNANGNLHGFLAVADLADCSKIRLGISTSAGLQMSGDLEVTPKLEALPSVVARIRGLVAETRGSSSENFGKLARAVVGKHISSEPSVVDVRAFGSASPTAPKPQISIIVPFYGDAFYLLDHLMAQSRAPASVEWIFVCDDPRLWQQMLETVSNRISLIHQPTRLIQLSANGGFAHANNIGARFAEGEYLLLMNSDIYCESFGFLERAMSILRAKPEVGCVGFSLQFEDGTIQHDGMTFRSSAVFDGLWLCEHANKGMPQNWKTDTEVAAEAVTAALMLLRQREFVAKPIFDPVYVIGDFEDADLCMRLRHEGQTISLLRTAGLYHLERQSVRHTGDGETRMAVTHLNCLTFNDRWRSMLSGQESR
jgi:GT2 family glycosyltransferase